jgi:hypothetical protein
MQRQIDPLWGYSFYYPDDWSYQNISGVDNFTPSDRDDRSASEAMDRGYLLVQPEWNASLKPVQPLWQTHIGRVAPMIGAKNVVTASWKMAGTQGLETEIVLPKSKEERLWVGILPFGHIVLKFVASHPTEDRSWFEPQASDIIKSLHFLTTTPQAKRTEEGIPLPPAANHIDPSKATIEIKDPSLWKGFEVGEAIGAIQAFYLRESDALGWSLEEFTPYPNDSGLEMARFRLRKEKQIVAVGLIPVSSQTGSSLTQILIKH